MINDQVKKLAHQLRLFGIHESFERRAAEAVSAQQHPSEFLRLALEDELIARKNRVAKMLTTRAKFRYSADLEDWDSSYDRGISKQRLTELAHLGFYHNKENLLLIGKTGEGKTHLSIALGTRLCSEGISTQFFSANLLFESATAQKAAGKYVQFVKETNRVDVVVIDDFALRSYTHDEGTVLVDLLEERYRRGSVIVTSQVDPAGWIKLFEDQVLAEAIVDRLTKPSQKIITKGGSYRDRFNVTEKSEKSDKKTLAQNTTKR